MRDFLINIFRETEINLEITLFSVWHIMYLVLIVGLSIALGFILRNKSDKAKSLTLKILAYAVTTVYILDFFIMPLSRESGEIDLDKLPFHICTLMALLVPFAQFNSKFEKLKEPIVCLSLVASLMYITYPGSALGGVGTFSYKVVQTFVYHGLLFSWGYLNIALNATKLEFKNIWKCAVGILIIIAWAFLGTSIYSNADHHYDWFFVTGTTFPFIPTWLMPFVVLFAVFGMCAIIYSINLVVRRIITKHRNKKTAIVES